MLLENEVPRAEGLIGEARALLGADADRLPSIAWAAGLLARFTGDRPAATRAIEAAIEGFAREEAHWERCQAMTHRVMLELEGGDADEARRRCGPLVEVAGKMTDGSEAAIAAALRALADRPGAGPEAAAAFEAAVAALVAADTKAMLAYVLNAAAAQDLAGGDVAAAEAHAGAALAAAAAVGRRSETAVARALLGRAALARGDAPRAKAQLDALREDREGPLGLSRRAAAAIDELANAVGRVAAI